MSLTPGTRLGPYEIVSAIGSGGMGDVYKARDTKLNRDVAIKVLSDEVADSSARRRFQREAQTASSLNHPHIVTVHDVGEFDGRQYLVTELVAGGTLAEWTRSASRSWRDVVELLVGVADGLATAHAAGILHRDIKPDNVLVSTSGYAKLADFGIAKLNEGAIRAATAQTVTGADTRRGLVIGTIPYMSPEQVSGQPADARSDLFSFGVLLYESLTGRRPFTGTSDLGVLAAIAGRRPDPLEATIPLDVRNLVDKLLEKDPPERYQSARDLVVDLRRVLRQTGEQTTRSRSRMRDVLPIAAGAIGVVAVVVVLLVQHWPSSAAVGHGPPQQLTNFADAVVSPSLSADGRMLTYIRGDSTFVARGEVYVQLLPSGEPVQLTHDTKQKMSPVFSPDGSRIAYSVVADSSDWDTWMVPVLGGEPRLFLRNTSGLTWIPSKTSSPRVLFSELTGQSIHMVLTTASEDRVEPRGVYAPPNSSGMAHRSFVSPDGRWVLVVEMLGSWQPCQLVALDGGSPRRAVGPASAPCTDANWSPDGVWMYFSANAGDGFHIWRQRFPNGVPEQVTTGVTEEQGVSFSPDGRSFVTSIGVEQNTVWLHTAGGDRQVTSQGYAYQPKLSADGRHLYYMLRSGVARHTWVSGELWVTNLDSAQRQRLFPDFLVEDYSVSPDGSAVAFSQIVENGPSPLWIASLEGGFPPRRLGDAFSSRPVFGPDGDVFYVQGGLADGSFLYRIKPDGTGRQKVSQEPARILYDISPDGKWAAAWMKDTGVGIYPLGGGPPIELCPLCGTVGAENRGITPAVVNWSRDGRYLFLHSAWTTRETYAIPLLPGHVLPPLPAGGIRSVQDVATLPGARRLDQLRAFQCGDPSMYAFMKVTSQRNIYRVPVP